ncbi:MAG: hypothetical protein GXY36_00160 [Chloroflexi bacterium]|jgi:hypothetical protein|nr:hypothetical protein [Chloroflexota bacterium]
MSLDFLTPEVWNAILLGVVFIGLALAILRLYSDLARPIGSRSQQPPAGDSRDRRFRND